MWKRSLFIAVICASFYLGVCGAQLLAEGYGWSSCSEGSVACPRWNCTYSYNIGGSNWISVTCSTCGSPGTTCSFTNCGNCLVNYFTPYCCQNFVCAGQYKGSDGMLHDCTCGAKSYPNNENLVTPFCQRKPSIWALFACLWSA